MQRSAGAVRVLSLQTALLGNKAYGELLRRLLANSPFVDFEGRWCPDWRELKTRGLGAFFWRQFPATWMRERNIDFFKTRYELGTSYLGRAILVDALRDATPDVIHIHTQAIAFLARDIIRRVPSVISADMTARQSAQQEVPPALRWTYELNHVLERRVFQDAAAIVTLSQWAADAIAAEHDIAKDRIHAIPPGTDLALFDEIRAARARRGDGRPTSVLFVGGEFERKGGDILARSFLERFAGRNVRLNIVTQTETVPKHDQIVVHRGVTPFSAAWSALYADADLFVLPTRRDGSPHVFVEAMAAGVPAIGTRVGSIPEMIDDGRTGYLIDAGDVRALGDRMERLVDDAPLRSAFGAAARALAEQQFDARRNIGRLEQVFVAASNRARRDAPVVGSTKMSYAARRLTATKVVRAMR
jgi:glycosyltransferase involved in cell wall biosynthesis